MNFKMVFNIIGRICKVTGILLLIPMIVAACYAETENIFIFMCLGIATFLFGLLLSVACKTKNHTIYAKEGFAVVVITWVIMSLIGAVPFVISGNIPSYIDAFFETVSGFTTTGASILTDVEAMSKSMLFWRSFTHWIGGMGVLVFVMALLPNVTDRPMHILKAEVPGPVVGKLVPKAKETAKILYLIYIALTLLEIALLLIGGMPFFDSVVHTFGTAGTGGFGIKGDSIAGYSPYCQWVITVFMLLFGVNFNVYFLLLIRRFKYALKSSEIWCYISIVAVSIAVITFNIRTMYDTLEETVRNSAFQVASIITTTGFSTVNFDLWPGLSKGILLVLMMIGACAGSTGGGIKVSRVVILFKSAAKEIRKMIHTRSVSSVHFEGKAVSGDIVSSVATYFFVYMICMFAAFLAISFEPFGFESNFSAVVACFNNIGPGFGEVGALGSYSEYSAFSKIVLSVAMLLGRLEIFPMLIVFSPKTWMKNK